MPNDLSDFDPEYIRYLGTQGFREFRVCGDAGLCGLPRFLFTAGLVVGLEPIGYQRRYCYETAVEAQAALTLWDGSAHPSGPWIVCKGAGVHLLNPNFVGDVMAV